MPLLYGSFTLVPPPALLGRWSELADTPPHPVQAKLHGAYKTKRETRRAGPAVIRVKALPHS